MVDALQKEQGCASLSGLNHSLQATAVCSSGVVVPCCGAIGHSALNQAAVQVAEDPGRHAKLPQSPQEIQPLLSSITTDNMEVNPR